MPEQPRTTIGRRLLGRAAAATLVMLLAACGGGAAENDPDSTPGVTLPPNTTQSPTEAPTPRPTPRPTARPTPTPQPRADIELIASGFTQAGDDGDAWVHVGLVFENPNPDTWVAEFVNVQLTFYGGDGAFVGSGDGLISTVLPGQRAAIGDVIFDIANAATMEVDFRVSDWFEIGFEPGEFTFSEVTTQPGEFGGWESRGLVHSTFEQDQENVRIDVIYFDAAGTIVGGEFTFVDFVPAGGQAGWETSTFSQFGAAVARTEVYATP